MKPIYVVLTKTGTILSRLISKITGDWYTHASVSFDDNLQTMYSFGRRWTHNPLIGGFMKESTEYGIMRKFADSDTVVIQVELDDAKYHEIVDYVTAMYAERKKYKYNYLGLFFSRWKVAVRSRKANRFYCSEFVNDILERFGIIKRGQFGKVVRPMELLKLQLEGIGKVIYRGALSKFKPAKIYLQ